MKAKTPVPMNKNRRNMMHLLWYFVLFENVGQTFVSAAFRQARKACPTANCPIFISWRQLGNGWPSRIPPGRDAKPGKPPHSPTPPVRIDGRAVSRNGPIGPRSPRVAGGLGGPKL